MPKSCIFKIIMIDTSKLRNNSNLNRRFDPFNEETFNHLGVSFRFINCIINNKDSYLLQIWDFNVMEEFKSLFPSFCKGARGAILYTDITDNKSFNELSYWIKIIRDIAGQIPIILIIYNSKSNRVISKDKINTIIEKYDLKRISIRSFQNFNYDIVFKMLIQEMGQIADIEEFNTVMPKYDKIFIDFIDYFSICPICKTRKNHFQNLKNFYFSQEKINQIIKEKLFELMEKLNDLKSSYFNNLEIGIPCCKCYEKYFR